MAIGEDYFAASARALRPEDNPWHDLSAFAVGTEFIGPVVRVMPYGYFVEIKRSVWGLVRPERAAGKLAEGDRVRVRVEQLDVEGQKVELAQV